MNVDVKTGPGFCSCLLCWNCLGVDFILTSSSRKEKITLEKPWDYIPHSFLRNPVYKRASL